MMTTPEEYEKSRRKYAWRTVQQLNVLHSELASLYRTEHPDKRRAEQIWAAIEMNETALKEIGIDYADHAA